MLNMKKNVALFFGTFNPMHIGHLAIGDYIAQLDEVDEVWFVVSPQNPLKEKESMLADYHRLAIVREAIQDNSRLRVSDIEFSMPIPSYTSDTLAYLDDKYPEIEFSIIMGQDNLKTFPKWKNYKVILDNYRVWVYPRVNTEYNSKHKVDDELIDELYTHEHVRLIKEVPVMAISSSFIRSLIKEGKEVKYLLSPPVLKYVQEMHFYEK